MYTICWRVICVSRVLKIHMLWCLSTQLPIAAWNMRLLWTAAQVRIVCYISVSWLHFKMYKTEVCKLKVSTRDPTNLWAWVCPFGKYPMIYISKYMYSNMVVICWTNTFTEVSIIMIWDPDVVLEWEIYVTYFSF